jgi:NADH-quinone oxidoreductase subunit M
MSFTSFPLISLSLTLLLVASISASRCRPVLAFRIALAASLIVLLLGAGSLLTFDFSLSSMQFEEMYGTGILGWHTGLDSFSLFFYLLVTLLTPLILWFFRNESSTHTSRFLAGILAWELVLLGAVSTLSLIYFWCWLALELVPLRMVSGLFGAQGGKVASVLNRYWSLMLALIFGAIVVIAMSGNESGLTLPDLAFMTDSAAGSSLAFILLFFGLAVRLPMFPFHGWLPVMVSHGNPVAAFCFLAGVKTGIVGMYRFALPLMSEINAGWTGFIELLALFSIFYGALLALMQINLYRLLAFAVISHTGILVIGLVTRNAFSLEGSMLSSTAFGLAAIGLILSTAIIQRKTGTAFIPRLGNLLENNTFPALLFLLAALSTMAMPGTPGYNAVHLLLEGVIEASGWGIAIAILIGNVLAAAFLLRAFQQIFIADSRQQYADRAKKILPIKSEVLVSSCICLLLLLTGFYPLSALLRIG